jgi:hypothetical protein
MSDVSASRAAGLHSQPITLFPRVPPRSFSPPSPPALFFMVEEKYVGLALAVSGTVAIGSSFIITKKVRNILSFRCRTTVFTFHHAGPQ